MSKQHRILRRHYGMAKYLAGTYSALEKINIKNTSTTLTFHTLPAIRVEINRLLRLPLHSPFELAEAVLLTCERIVRKRVGETITIKMEGMK